MNIETIKNRMYRAGQTSGTSNTRESNLVSSGIRAYLKSNFMNVQHSKGHFYCSGFVQKNGYFVYYSTGDYRTTQEPSILIRTAKGFKDYTGGTNEFVKLEGLVSGINRLIKQQEFKQEVLASEYSFAEGN